MYDPGMTIAIVDDDVSVCRALRRLFTAVGGRTEAFTSASEFIARGGIETWDCLVLDMQLPGMTGLELQEQLNDAEHDVPIVFITAYSTEQIRTSALEAGAAAVMEKPLDADDLLDAVDGAVTHRIPEE